MRMFLTKASFGCADCVAFLDEDVNTIKENTSLLVAGNEFFFYK